jgi:lysozyme
VEKEKLRELITLHEGLRLKPYYCTAGKLTIGIGRNLDTNGISENEAIFLLDNDIRTCIESLKQKKESTFEKLDGVRQMVVVDMCFNLGITGLLKFKKFWAALEAGDWSLARDEMLDSRWAGQVGDRAIRLANMMEFGEWPF